MHSPSFSEKSVVCLAELWEWGAQKVGTESHLHYETNALLNFFLSTEPWTYAHSRSAKQLYFYNKDTHESTFEIPRDSVASFK